jgi:hypothetical protein
MRREDPVSFDRRIYRVQGERPDGSTHTRDYLSLQKADAAASALMKPRTVDHGGAQITLPPLTNVRLTRSAPIRWLYVEQEPRKP